MHHLIFPAVFYVIFSIYIVYMHKNKGFGILCSTMHFETLKYHGLVSIFFFININIMFYCMFCKECNTFCLAFTLLGVSLGLIIYLWHLGKQTVFSIKQMASLKEFDFMAPFFALPYFELIHEIIFAINHSSLVSLQPYESKMISGVLYPFFIVLGELNTKIKALKENSIDDSKFQ
jgi:hypothetical protein